MLGATLFCFPTFYRRAAVCQRAGETHISGRVRELSRVQLRLARGANTAVYGAALEAQSKSRRVPQVFLVSLQEIINIIVDHFYLQLSTVPAAILSYEMFHYGGYGDYYQWMTPPPGCFQLVPVQPEKAEKKKEQKVTLKVKMCCSKCEEKVTEEICEVPGVEKVEITDRASSKVVVIGEADSEQVLKKAKRVDKKAKLKEEEKEEEEAEEESQYNSFAYVCAPISFGPVPPMEQSGPYRHSQSYGPSSSSYYPPEYYYYHPPCPTWYPYYPWYPY